jgi:type IV secretion system T-DNA border endonuclease VirD2
MGLFSDEKIKKGGAKPSDRNRSKSRNRQKLHRVSRKCPETMVKITGFTKSNNHLESHICYISRDGKVPVKTSSDIVLNGPVSIKSISQIWGSDLSITGGKPGRRPSRITTNIVLSIPKGDPNRLTDAAEGFAKTTFHNHDWVMALHTDTDHPHVHLTVRNLGHDGTRLHIPKGKTQEWREDFAEALRGQGIEAEATRRAERGVTRKGEKQAVKYLRERLNNLTPPKAPEVDKVAVREAQERLAGKGKPEPWKEKILARQKEMRAMWERVGQGLAKSPNPEDQALAKQVLAFRKDMPPIRTRNDDLLREIHSYNTNNNTKESTPER